MVARARPEILGTLVVVLQRADGDVFEVLWFELHREVEFLARGIILAWYPGGWYEPDRDVIEPCRNPLAPFDYPVRGPFLGGPIEPETNVRKLMALSPYLILEIFMPGGTVLAFLLYLARRNLAAAARD
jgi:hypothetical protein